jgi:hypothetical protein
VVSCQANCKPHATGTRAAVRSVCSPASNETIGANPKRLRAAVVVSFQSVGSSSSSPSPCWPRHGTAVWRPRIRSCRRRSRAC